MSKAAMNMAAVCLARDLASRGVAVLVVHPGMVDTEMFARFRPSMPGEMTAGTVRTPADAARGILARLDELTLERSARAMAHVDGGELPW